MDAGVQVRETRRERKRGEDRTKLGATRRSFDGGELRGDSVARSEGCYDKGLRYLSGGDRQINEKGSHEREED